MKAIIIGTPGKGKTTLANMIREDYPDARIISLGSLRGPLGIHEPRKGYEAEIAPENTALFCEIVSKAMNCDDFIVEGYGLAPEDALRLANNHTCPVILLCHKSTTALQDYIFVRKYDDKDKWTAKRPDEYLKRLYEFYKTVEDKWISRMPEEMIFSTDKDFDRSIREAYQYIIDNQNAIKTYA